MSRRAALPLNVPAVRKSDDEFYVRHPEFIKNGKRVPLDPVDPKQASLRSEWMDLYDANNVPPAARSPSKKVPADVCQSCPGQLVITVLEPDGKPVVGATVRADALRKQTDSAGVADFGIVDAKTYEISASKEGYTPWAASGNLAVPESDTVEVLPQGKATAELGLQSCIAHSLAIKPFLIATAAVNLTPPIQRLTVPGSVGGTLELDFGQDSTTNLAEAWPRDENDLRAEMYALLDYFAANDTDGKARRLFDAFLNKQKTVNVYTDPDLDKAIAAAGNFNAFPDRTLNAPGSQFFDPSKKRIHQLLAEANWDVNSVATIWPPSDFKPPAFKTADDQENGLFVMTDAVEYVLVFVDQYQYNSCEQKYTIALIFELYDIFGLDDEDLEKYGAGSMYADLPQTRPASKGITAWWQLQHQYNYFPLITKAVVIRTFNDVPAK